MSLSQRRTFIASHTPEDMTDRRRQSGSSSPGLDEDEADDVPYRQVNSIEETIPQSPLRPRPGGSFPSETSLADQVMYNRHSRAASDGTLEPPSPIAIVKSEEASPTFHTEWERPYTGQTQLSAANSIGDDRDFTAITAGAATGPPVRVNDKDQEHGTKEDMHRKATEKPTEHSDTTTYGAEIAASTRLGKGSTEQRSDTLRPTKLPPLIVPTMAGISLEEDGKLDTSSAPGFIHGQATEIGVASDLDSRLGFIDRPPRKESNTLRAKPPKDEDIAPTKSNGLSKLATPTSPTIKRSKSRKEIVEEAIADSIGNHPERGVMPGFWPETPKEGGRAELLK